MYPTTSPSRVTILSWQNVTQIGYPFPSSFDRDYRFILDNAFTVGIFFDTGTGFHYGIFNNYIKVRVFFFFFFFSFFLVFCFCLVDKLTK